MSGGLSLKTFLLVRVLPSIFAARAISFFLSSTLSHLEAPGGSAAGGLRLRELPWGLRGFPIANAPGLESDDGGSFPFFLGLSMGPREMKLEDWYFSLSY